MPRRLAAFDRYGRELSEAVMIALYAYDPEAVIFGGSISAAFDLFEAGLREGLDRFAYPRVIERLVIDRRAARERGGARCRGALRGRGRISREVEMRHVTRALAVATVLCALALAIRLCDGSQGVRSRKPDRSVRASATRPTGPTTIPVPQYWLRVGQEMAARFAGAVAETVWIVGRLQGRRHPPQLPGRQRPPADPGFRNRRQRGGPRSLRPPRLPGVAAGRAGPRAGGGADPHRPRALLPPPVGGRLRRRRRVVRVDRAARGQGGDRRRGEGLARRGARARPRLPALPQALGDRQDAADRPRRACCSSTTARSCRRSRRWSTSSPSGDAPSPRRRSASSTATRRTGRGGRQLDDPPGDIGRAILDRVPNTEGLYWVDFTVLDLFPTGAR